MRFGPPTPSSTTDLTFVLCSRNDRYQGDAVWRLSTALNYLAMQAERLDVASRLEVLVSDWGSPTPLREAVELTPEAAALTRFVEIPLSLTEELQGNSPFCEVLANNAAIRRAAGRFVGRIDQDTLVGADFLGRFLSLVESSGRDRSPEESELAARVERSFTFIGRRGIPLRFAESCPDIEVVASYVERFGRYLPREGSRQRPWFDAPVGVLVMSRDLWWEYGAYDETLRFWGFMETDLGLRTAVRHQHLDLERFWGSDFFHLGHTSRRLKRTTRRRNPRCYPSRLHPNGDAWGLADYDLTVADADARLASPTDPGRSPSGLMGLAVGVAAERVAEEAIGAARWARGLVKGDRIHLPPPPSRLEEPPPVLNYVPAAGQAQRAS